ncbi:hypothetical protein FRB95_010958 [Tulasnella sp. JGI-2019a]|nr:hypothetical protein FRB95_010958 [Tulasnella sp. JGI-2019a]
MRKFFNFSSTLEPAEIAEIAEIARLRQAKEDRRREHIQIGRTHNMNMARNTDRPDASRADDANEGMHLDNRQDNLDQRDDGTGSLQRPSDIIVSHVTTSADGKIVLNPNAAHLFHGEGTARRTEEALRVIKSAVKDPIYLESGQSTLLRRNLPLRVTALWRPASSPTAETVDLFSGQTIIFCRLVQMASYYVVEGLCLAEHVVDVMGAVLAGGPPPEATIVKLWKQRNSQLRECTKLIRDMDELLQDLEDSPINDLAVSEHTATRRQQNIWRTIVITGALFGSLSVAANFGAEIANLVDHTSEGVKAAVVQTASVSTYVGWAASGVMYQMEVSDQEAERHKTQALMLSSAFSNLVNIKHCAKHFKHSFESLLKHLALPLFEDHSFEDEYFVLDKWKATKSLYELFHERVKNISRVMIENEIPLPAHPYSVSPRPSSRV